jgi:hypothetical protein
MEQNTQIEYMSFPVELAKRLMGDLAEESENRIELRKHLSCWSERRVTSVRVPAYRYASTEDTEGEFFTRGWNACLEKVKTLNTVQNICTLQGDGTEPEVFLHVHELLSNGGGVWLGNSSEEIVRKNHDDGETGPDVIALVRLSDQREHVAPLVAEIASLRTELEEERSIRSRSMTEEELASLSSLEVVGHGVFLVENGQQISHLSTEGPKALKFGHDCALGLLRIPSSGVTEVSDIEPLVRLSGVHRLVAAMRASAGADFEQDALRWRAVIGCARLRALGSSGLTSDFDFYGNPHGNNAHIGLELWTMHDAGTEELGVRWFNKFADKAVAVMLAKAEGKVHD